MKHDPDVRQDGLSFATCQAGNTVPISKALATYLSRRLPERVRFLDGLDWRDAYEGIKQGDIDLGWICSRPYVRLADHAPISLLAAPVMAGARYANQPVYFSYVIVRVDDTARGFADLRGRVWVYNEPGSQSGYHIMRQSLARKGLTTAYFSRAYASGGHVNSIEAVLRGEADTSAIDSTVLEWEMSRRPALKEQLRVIAVLGPSPIPPLVVSSGVPERLREALRAELVALDQTDEGRTILETGRLRRFAAVVDADYEPIRRLDALADQVEASSRG
jgi:phosphonate transport system substrate-binding protein